MEPVESPCDAWLYDCNLSSDPEQPNPRLIEWLIEYKLDRPHQSLSYLTPIEYIEKQLAKIRSPSLPMWSASTPGELFANLNMLLVDSDYERIIRMQEKEMES